MQRPMASKSSAAKGRRARSRNRGYAPTVELTDLGGEDFRSVDSTNSDDTAFLDASGREPVETELQGLDEAVPPSTEAAPAASGLTPGVAVSPELGDDVRAEAAVPLAGRLSRLQGDTATSSPAAASSEPRNGPRPGVLAPPGLAPPGLAPPGLAPPGLAPPGLAPPGLAPPGLAPPGLGHSESEDGSNGANSDTQSGKPRRVAQPGVSAPPGLGHSESSEDGGNGANIPVEVEKADRSNSLWSVSEHLMPLTEEACPQLIQRSLAEQLRMKAYNGLKEVPITAEIGLDETARTLVGEAQMFKDWVTEVDRDPRLFIDAIHLQSVDMFRDRCGFVKFKTDARIVASAGRGVVDVPGIVFMRGGAVGMLVILECEGAEYTILTRQARVPIGKHDLPEIPAGMLGGSGNFEGVAAEEIRQECNINIHKDELVDLTYLAYGDRFRGIFPSAGACDEYIKLYMVRRTVDRDVLTQLQGRLTGVLKQGESIKLQLVHISETWATTPDVKALSALALYKNLQDAGRLPDRAEAGNGRQTSVDDLEEGDRPTNAGSIVRYGRQSQFSSLSQLTKAEEEAAQLAASVPTPGTSTSVNMQGISGKLVQVPITTEPGIDAEVVSKSSNFKNWVAELDSDPVLFVEDIHIQSVDCFGPRVGFVKFTTTAKAKTGPQRAIEVPGIVFVRGGAVGMLIILECEGEQYTILTRQARVAVGRHDLPEIPASMIEGSDNFKEVAVELVRQECGFNINEDEVDDLTDLAYGREFKGVFPSAGGCDEFIKLYMVRREVDKEVLAHLHGRFTGLLAEGEHIKLEIVPLADLWELSADAKALSALVLYDYLKKHLKLPDRRQKALSAKELREETDGGLNSEGHPSPNDSKSHKLGRGSQAWSMSSNDSHVADSERLDSVGQGAPEAPTHVKQAKRERLRRRSVSFGVEKANTGVRQSVPSPALSTTRASAQPNGASPRSALRRGSIQDQKKQQAAGTIANSASPRTASTVGATDGLEQLQISVPEPCPAPKEGVPYMIETEPWTQDVSTHVAESPNPLDLKIRPLGTSLHSTDASYDAHSNMSADEDEVDRLLMDDLLEATQATATPRSPRSSRGRRTDAVVVPRVVNEPPTQLAQLYLKADSSNTAQMILMILTLIALFGDDVRLLILPKEADSIASHITFVIFLIFSLEWIFQCLFKPGYVLSLFWGLDLLATVSLLADVIFIYEAIFGELLSIYTIEAVCVPASDHIGATADSLMDGAYGAGANDEIERTGRAARVASRTARMIRLLRVLRVLRIFKLLKFYGNTDDDTGASINATEKLRERTTLMGARLVEKISHRVIIVVLVLFVGTISVLHHHETVDNGPQIGLDWMGAMRMNETVGGPPIISWLAANTYVGSMPKNLLCLKDLNEGGQLFRHMPADISSRRDIEVLVSWASDGSVMSALDNREAIVSQARTNLIIILTLLLIMVGSKYVFTSDIEELVVRKIAVIVNSVYKMSETLKFLNGDGEGVDQNQEEEHEMETEMIETAMEKMSELLRIGYGKAGNTIISKNLRGTGELNAMLPGQHVTAVFGFCDIRKFNEITDVLRGQVMPFVNQIAKIVHEEVVLNDGAPNKNIGDAFLCSWKTEEFTETPRSQKGLDRDEQTKHKLRMRRLSLAQVSSADFESLQSPAGDSEIPVEYNTKADQALKSFVDVIEKLRSRKTELILRKRHPRIYMHNPSFKVDMGFGLHHGWAIEGAIGSVHKIDVSYLSPHVNMSARLEAATKQFGVPLLLSGSFVKLLSGPVRETCRKLDSVKVVGSNKIVELWTRDVPQIKNRAFKKAFARAVDLYINGNWERAMEKLHEAGEHVADDPPMLALRATIERLGIKDYKGIPQKPRGWEGWRQLQSK